MWERGWFTAVNACVAPNSQKGSLLVWWCYICKTKKPPLKQRLERLISPWLTNKQRISNSWWTPSYSFLLGYKYIWRSCLSICCMSSKVWPSTKKGLTDLTLLPWRVKQDSIKPNTPRQGERTWWRDFRFPQEWKNLAEFSDDNKKEDLAQYVNLVWIGHCARRSFIDSFEGSSWSDKLDVIFLLASYEEGAHAKRKEINVLDSCKHLPLDREVVCCVPFSFSEAAARVLQLILATVQRFQHGKHVTTRRRV